MSEQDVDRLLKEGAAVNWADHNGYTALSEAAMAGHTVVVGQLLRAAADAFRMRCPPRCAFSFAWPWHCFSSLGPYRSLYIDPSRVTKAVPKWLFIHEIQLRFQDPNVQATDGRTVPWPST